MRINRFSRRALAIMACALLPCSGAQAGGFYLQEQSPLELGRAFSGGAAADSPATVFYNPAGMTALSGTQIDLGGHAIIVDADQRDLGSTRTVPGLPQPVPANGSDGGKPFSTPVLAPSAYLVAQVSDRVALGLGLTSPFGLVVDYDDDFFGRYDSLRSELLTINVQPSIAMRLSDTVSIGGGVDIQYAEAQLTNALPNLSPLQADGLADISGEDISLGWNAGVLANFGDVQLGLHYRSRIDHELRGTLTLEGLQGPLAAANGAFDAGAELALPDIATASALFRLADDWRIMATARWYNWSRFSELVIVPEGSETQVREQGFADTVSAALGLEFDANERLTLRLGTMYDETPTQDGVRTTRVPDGNRVWLTAGMSYRLNDRFQVNAGYARVWSSTELLDRTDAFYEGTPAQIETRVRSESAGGANILGLSVISRF